MSRNRPHKGPVRRVAGIAVAVLLGVGSVASHAQDVGERYAKLYADTESFARYNDTLTKQIASQQQRLADVESQSAALDATAANLAPLLSRMHGDLEKFVAQDLPFLDPIGDSADSRKDRMQRLKDMMSDAGLNSAEKYRRLLEAYQIEIEYGRSVAAYPGQLDDGRKAEFVRVGRVALLYRTEDGQEAGYWDHAQKTWVVDNDYRDTVAQALRVAKKEVAPDVMFVPVPPAQEARS
jgi:uncharacterized protein YigA (DUF484 family)